MIEEEVEEEFRERLVEEVVEEGVVKEMEVEKKKGVDKQPKWSRREVQEVIEEEMEEEEGWWKRYVVQVSGGVGS